MNAANERSLYFSMTRSETDAFDTQHTQQGLNTGHMSHDRMITAEKLRGKISENNNLSPQQEDLYNVLIKYQQHLNDPADALNSNMNLKEKEACQLVPIQDPFPLL
jgi:hypothetical protein